MTEVAHQMTGTGDLQPLISFRLLVTPQTRKNIVEEPGMKNTYLNIAIWTP
jgi:hypothetical protein